jgi:PAS domain S-box-containing protein
VGAQSDTQQDLILQHMNDAVIVLGPDFRIQSWNRAAETIYGWRAEEVVGQPMSKILPPRYLDGTNAAATLAIIEHDGIWTGEVAHPHRDGHEILIESSVRFLRDAQGVPIGLVGINRDITQRKQAEEDRIQLLALLDTLLATAPVGFAFYDPELRFVRVNEAMAAINGLPVEAHLGRRLAEVVPHAAPNLEPLFERILATGIPVVNLEIVGEPPFAPSRQCICAKIARRSVSR